MGVLFSSMKASSRSTQPRRSGASSISYSLPSESDLGLGGGRGHEGEAS